MKQDWYSRFQPGDHVYFIENRGGGGKWMAFCRIDNISKDPQNSRLTKFKLEIIKQPKKGGFFVPLNTLSKMFTVSRTPEASGVSGMWRFETPESFERDFRSFEITMDSWQSYKRPMLLRLGLILGGILLLLGSCFLLALRLLN